MVGAGCGGLAGLQVVLDDVDAVERYRVDPVHRAYADVFLKPMLERIHVFNFERF